MPLSSHDTVPTKSITTSDESRIIIQGAFIPNSRNAETASFTVSISIPFSQQTLNGSPELYCHVSRAFTLYSCGNSVLSVHVKKNSSDHNIIYILGHKACATHRTRRLASSSAPASHRSGSHLHFTGSHLHFTVSCWYRFRSQALHGVCG